MRVVLFEAYMHIANTLYKLRRTASQLATLRRIAAEMPALSCRI
jgi:hypothetical protein